MVPRLLQIIISMVFVLRSLAADSSNNEQQIPWSLHRYKRQTTTCAKKYSTITIGHSACLPQSPDYVSGDVSDAEKQVILDMHNKARREVTPTATNMQLIKWDDEIAGIAQRWAENCVISHDARYNRYAFGRFYVGQNLAWGSDLNWQGAIKLWENEKSDFTFGGPNSGSVITHYTQVWKNEELGTKNEEIGMTYNESLFVLNVLVMQLKNLNAYETRNCSAHHTDPSWGNQRTGEQSTNIFNRDGRTCSSSKQMVWADTSKIGCGYALCGSTHYYVCNYGPAGNSDIHNPYESGTTCNSCPNSCNNGLCECDRTCLNGGTMDLNTCSCTCIATFYIQPDCALNCTGAKDPGHCSLYNAEVCEMYTNVPQECPNKCSWCPTADFQFTSTGTITSLQAFYFNLIYLFIFMLL